MMQESGGMMALTDIYCRVNRARGMEVGIIYMSISLIRR